MHKSETESATTADIELYEPAELSRSDPSLIPQIGSVFRQLANMSHSYNYYNFQVQHQSENDQDSEQSFESHSQLDQQISQVSQVSQASSPQLPQIPQIPITAGDVVKFEDSIFSDLSAEPLGNYITTPALGQIPNFYEQPVNPDISYPQQVGEIPEVSADAKKRRKTGGRTQPPRRKRNRDAAPSQYTFVGILPDKPLTPFHFLPYYRQLNGLSFENFKHLNNMNPHIIYERNKKFQTNVYEPAVNKKYSISTEEAGQGKLKASSQGNFALCPYCQLTHENLSDNCERMFYKRNDSNYLHHMIQYHGIFSNGELVKDPEVRGWALTPTDKSPVEVVQCPYCGDFVSLKKFKPDNQNEHRLLKYLRHVKERHKTGKNLQIVQRQHLDLP
ncbi:DEKNAAC100434 [Brettanomyces naardenensis]|uniref:DEKNAAC100434 n=1 Tax=Brettanomyces naardenensis TaxID=13370 RepID=A0A448YFF8_BRENA|nr:DEKNAAC100434 [Brettanomyces naardenensis]